MKISIIIPFKNEFDEIDNVIGHLLRTSRIGTKNLEIIVVNDGSVQSNGRFRPLELNYPCVRVLNNSKSFGVGHAFDSGVRIASHDTIILMGADVFPDISWDSKVIEAVNSNPETLGCAVCVGDKPPYRKYYGADLLITVGNDDLPTHSKLRQRTGGYTSLFKAKWKEKVSDVPYELPCLLGAMYFTSKAYYNKIHGWDTEPNNKFIGFRSYGSLEPFISLKSWLYGGGCTMYPNIEAIHIFNRINKHNRWSKGGRSAEWTWWNAIWVLETMVLSEFTRHRLYDFVNPELNFNVAKKMIKDHYNNIEMVRDRNFYEFKNDLSWYMDKFGYKI